LDEESLNDLDLAVSQHPYDRSWLCFRRKPRGEKICTSYALESFTTTEQKVDTVWFLSETLKWKRNWTQGPCQTRQKFY